MDGIEIKKNPAEILKKYRYVLLVFLVGLFLMLIPQPNDTAQEILPETEAAEEQTLQSSLEEILSKIDGAGKTEVLLTESTGAQTFYQADEDLSSSESSKEQRRQTVIITNGSREEQGLIRRMDPPEYKGAVILCQGAEDARVRLSIVEAVSNATGLSTDKISVLKMK